MNDPRLARVSEFRVLSTAIPLSERFKLVPAHNPLRPNGGRNRAEVEESLEAEPEPSYGRLMNHSVARDPLGSGFGCNVNKVAVVRASKDAQILRLKEQLQRTQMQLRGGGGRNGGRGNGNLHAIQKPRGNGIGMRNRTGGGLIVGRRGDPKRLNLLRQDALEILGSGSNNNNVSGRTRRNQGFGRGKGRKSDEDLPKSKADLDEELEAYMSRSKSKVRTDLDQELDAYMTVAKSKKTAVFGTGTEIAGGTPNQPETITINDEVVVADEDVEMETDD